ncbi:periplasmic copper-binding protein (NosD) [mine drainage metagenome]|uniref:Periplasmic copper-binding protein (NosD) n=1 Tax=mine drainage metagenome TaxID=410659 RepID=A0A1J5PCM5_9ZZZZ
MPRCLKLFLGACLFLANCSAYAADWHVAPGQRIADAISKAAPGDTVLVARGHYTENLKIDKALHLIGVDRPTLSGGGHGDTIRVTVPDVDIEGLIIRDSGTDLTAQNAGIYLQPGAHRARVSHCDLIYNLFGLWIEGSNQVLVEDNLITGLRDFLSSQRGNGIELYNTQGARIIHNNISFVRDAIYVDLSHHAQFLRNRLHNSRYGTHYMNSYHNVWAGNETYLNRGGLALMEVRDQIVRDNVAWGNTDHGIMLRTIQNSLIENNIVAGNGRGFFIYDAENDTLRGNLVVDNLIGMHLSAGSTHNSVESNDFIDNHEQIKYVASHDEIWGAKEGNYWSNYLGWDRDGNGRGDIPYEANDIVDRLSWEHPMMKLLLGSPAVQTLRLVARQFPLLRAPSVVDPAPRMQPLHANWRQWLGKYHH